MLKRRGLAILVALTAGTAASLVSAQTATMPPHAAGFTGNTRGYWFTAPVGFTITGVQVMQIANPGSNAFQNWAIVKFDGNTPPPTFATVTNAFQQLGLGLNQPANAYAPTSIVVNAGDVIGVYGNTAAASGTTTGVNSYTATLTQATTTILGNPVNLNRSGMQFHLGSATSPAGMHDLWAEPASTAISRVEFTYAPLGVTGACCLGAPNFGCAINTAAGCASAGGTYAGDNVTCAAANCPPPPSGACCKFDGSCSILTPAACTASGGTYQGNNSVCGSCPTPPPVIYTNCNLATGTTTLSGVGGLPVGSEWSEVARDETDLTTANTTAGFTGTGALRLADDFVVPAGGMNLGYVRVYAYLTGATTPGVTAATLRILDGPPTGTPNVVFGDQTTNRLAANIFAPLYRCFNTVAAPVCAGAATLPDQNRHLQYVYIAVNQFLPAGTYWIDFNYTGASFSPPNGQADAIGRQCNPANSNALQFNAAWVACADAGQGCAPVAVNQDLAFDLLGTFPAATCYPNCDGSTSNPLLTANDFQCFLNEYAAGHSYANCDGSTSNPLLTANDFQCFLNAYAAGCS